MRQTFCPRRHSGDARPMRVTTLICDGTGPSHPIMASHHRSASMLHAAESRKKSPVPGRTGPSRLRHSAAMHISRVAVWAIATSAYLCNHLHIDYTVCMYCWGLTAYLYEHRFIFHWSTHQPNNIMRKAKPVSARSNNGLSLTSTSLLYHGIESRPPQCSTMLSPHSNAGFIA